MKLKNAVFVIAAAMIFGVSDQAEAKRRVDPLIGLTPGGYVVQNSQSKLVATELQGARIAIIPTQNFLNHVAQMQKWFNPKKYRNLLGQSPSGDVMNFLVHASEPRNLTDRFVDKLVASGAVPLFASSFPDAKAQGADFFLVFDYHGEYKDISGVGSFINPFAKSKYEWKSGGGLHFFNQRLERLLQIDATGSEQYQESIFVPGMNESALSTGTMIAGSRKKFLDDLIAKWGAALQ